MFNQQWLDFAKQETRAFLVAIQFLTRLPVNTIANLQEEDIAGSLKWYPLVGFIMGCLLWIISVFLPEQLPNFLSATLLLSLWVYLSGALHLDGFADCVDAWVGGLGDREKTLSIMKDPTSGPMAIVALILLLMMKLACLVFILSTGFNLMLVVIPVIARAIIVITFLTVPYVQRKGLQRNGVQRDGLGTPFESVSWENCIGLLLLCIAVLWLLLPFILFCFLAATAAIIFVIWRYNVMKRLDGFTGDCVGALVEFQELGLLIGMSFYISLFVSLPISAETMNLLP